MRPFWLKQAQPVVICHPFRLVSAAQMTPKILFSFRSDPHPGQQSSSSGWQSERNPARSLVLRQSDIEGFSIKHRTRQAFIWPVTPVGRPCLRPLLRFAGVTCTRCLLVAASTP